MAQFRSLLEQVRSASRRKLEAGSGGRTVDGRVYKCVTCGCTTDTQDEYCQICQIGSLVPAGRTYESKPGFVCRECDAAVDYRYELCPECGSPRFKGSQ